MSDDKNARLFGINEITKKDAEVLLSKLNPGGEILDFARIPQAAAQATIKSLSTLHLCWRRTRRQRRKNA